jgi:hypothetical protein
MNASGPEPKEHIMNAILERRIGLIPLAVPLTLMITMLVGVAIGDAATAIGTPDLVEAGRAGKP